MSMIRKYSSVLITDILVLSLLCSLSYIILHTFPLAPYSKSFSKFLNDTYFMMIPAGVYIAYRVYFQISFYILHLIRQYLQSKLQFLDNLLSYLFVFTGIGCSLYFPSIQNTINNIYQLYIGTLFQEVYKISKPEIQKSSDFGYKVITLLGGWFVLLFTIELILRIVLYVITSLYQLTMQSPKKLSISSVKEQNCKEEYNTDDINKQEN